MLSRGSLVLEYDFYVTLSIIFKVITACSELRKVLFLAQSVCGFLFVYEISWKPLNGLAPNSYGRRLWSLAHKSLKVKVWRSKVKVTRDKKWHFSALSAACMQFEFDKTSLASSFILFPFICSFSYGHFYLKLEMWANAQRDGRPAKYRWRSLFNTAKFGWRPLLECCAVTLQDAKPFEICRGVSNSPTDLSR